MSARRNAADPAALARRFRELHARGIEVIIEKGRILALAKEQLLHGDYLPFLAAIGITKSYAAKLKRIAEHKSMAKVSRGSPLPEDVQSLALLARLDPRTLERLAADGKIRPGISRFEIERLVAEQIEPQPPAAADVAQPEAPPVGKRYGAILADPPWPFETWSDAGKGRSPERHYPTMSLQDIKAFKAWGRPVADLAADDCALFLWAVAATAHEAIEVIHAWGFVFKTVAFIWVKDGAFGNGYWTRQRAEACLLASRGRPERLNADVDQVITAPRRQHSRKPDETYDRIERLVVGPYLELFARQRRPGWDSAGNETGKFDREGPS